MLFELPTGNSTVNDSRVLPVGQISTDTTNKNIRIHDGTTAGGHATENAQDVAP